MGFVIKGDDWMLGYYQLTDNVAPNANDTVKIGDTIGRINNDITDASIFYGGFLWRDVMRRGDLSVGIGLTALSISWSHTPDRAQKDKAIHSFEEKEYDVGTDDVLQMGVPIDFTYQINSQYAWKIGVGIEFVLLGLGFMGTAKEAITSFQMLLAL